MTNHYNDPRSQLGNPELLEKVAKHEQDLTRFARPSTTWVDCFERIMGEYRQQWREQPFNFACMHFVSMTLLGALYFAIFILPSPF